MELLDKKELKNAFGCLQSFLNHAPDAISLDKVLELEETYKRMLNYRLIYAPDPMQKQIYDDMLSSLYEIAELTKLRLMEECEAPPVYYALRKNRSYFDGNQAIKDLYNRVSVVCEYESNYYYEKTLIQIFNRIWLSARISHDEYNDITEILDDEKLPCTTGCQVVSALVLSLFSYFDKEKFLLLLHASDEGKHEEVRARALIGLLIMLYIHHKRTGFYPQISNRLAALAETPGFAKRLRTITLKFILAKETDKITRKLHDEIIPKMTKYVPNMNKMNIHDFNPEMFEEENPEWQEMLEDTALGKSIEEYNELQMEGADVMHSTFAYLKHFDFFRDMSNWFLPFMSNHSNLEELEDDDTRNGLRSITDALIFLCNSDKYSFLLSIIRQPSPERQRFLSQLHGNTIEAMSQFKDIIVGEKGKFDVIVSQCIQDLYRFFKLHHFRGDYNDIFLLPLDFYNLPILRPYLSDNESLSIIAEYYLKKNYFDEAFDLFMKLKIADPNNDMLMQKAGYCQQMKGDIDAAIAEYIQADLINTQSKWLIKRIAGCYRATGRPAQALEYYRRLESMNPDNLSIQLSIGHCYLELGEHAESLKYYFKVDYLDTKTHRAWRPLAWALFLAGKYDQAFEYYKKLLEEGANNDTLAVHDFINAGHTSWARKKFSEAINYYFLAIKSQEGDEEYDFKVDMDTFIEYFEKDLPYLVAAGIDKNDVPFMFDQLRYMMD
jgi:tetratricopeptide (TPR) repeat protein